MPGDFSRFLFNPQKAYNKVLLQQGRVQLDADWNAQADMIADRFHTLGRDLFGLHGGPTEDPGFEISEHRALRFDGIDDWISFSKNDALAFKDKQPFTIELWTRPAAGDQRGGVLLSRFNQPDIKAAGEERALQEFSDHESGYKLFLDKTGLLGFYWVEVDDNGNPIHLKMIKCNTPLRFNCYHHIAVVFDGDDVALFIDTHLAARGAWGKNMSAEEVPFAIGAQMSDDHPVGFYGGDIAEVRLWTAARTPNQLRTFLMSTPTDKNTKDLLACWRFDEGFDLNVQCSVGSGFTGLLGNGKSPAVPERLPADLWIGPGRYYAEGLLCRQSEVFPFSEQPDLPGRSIAKAMPHPGTYLAYLEAWEQTITPVQDPTLMEPALNGLETSVRTRIVQQVRLTPLQEAADNTGTAGFTQFTSSRIQQALKNKNVNEIPSGAMAARCETTTTTPGNQLYRIEIHSSGVPYGSGAYDAGGHVSIEKMDQSQQQITLTETTLHMEEWESGQLIEIYSDRHNPGFLASVIDVSANGLDLIIYPFPDEVSKNNNPRVRRIAGFKWSRNNASRVLPIKSANFENGMITPKDFAYLDAFKERNLWVEVLNNDTLLNNRTNILVQTNPVNNPFRLSTVQTPKPIDVSPGACPFVRAWDMTGNNHLWRSGIPMVATGVDMPADLTPSVGHDTWYDLEYGLQIRFSDGYYHRGDHWPVPTRSLLERRVEWPVDDNGAPMLQAPALMRRYRSPLALVIKEPMEAPQTSGDGTRTDLPQTVSFGDETQASALAPPPEKQYQLRIQDLRRFFGPMPALTERIRKTPQVGPHNPRQPVNEPQVPDSSSPPVTDKLVYLDTNITPPEGFGFTGLSLKADPWSPLPLPEVYGWEGALVACLRSHQNIYLMLDSGQLWRYGSQDQSLTQCDGLPEPRTRFGVCTAQGRIYVMGGQDSRGRLSTNSDCFDPETDTWSRCEPLPKPRTDVTLAGIEGRVYVMGGRKHALFGLIKHITNRIDIYDVESDIWAEGALPKLPRATAGMAFVASTNHLYLSGGCEPAFLGLGARDSRAHHIWYIQDGTWVRLANLPNPVTSPAMIGGQKGLHLMGGLSNGKVLKTHHIYREENDTWQVAEPMPDPAPRPLLVTAGDDLWLFHGTGSVVEAHRYVQAGRLYVHRPLK